MIHAATKLALLKLDNEFRAWYPRSLWTEHYMRWYQHYRGILLRNYREVVALESEQGGAQ